MAYIRTKKINGTQYAYLVENINTARGPRQKVKKYLGRTYQFENKFEQSSEGNVLTSLVLEIITPFGFKKVGKVFVFNNLIFDPRKCSIKTNNGKEAIIALQEGYLCTYTLEKIRKFKKGEDVAEDGNKLARYFLSAGLPIDEERFVKFYGGN